MSREKQIEEMARDIPSRIIAYNCDPKGAHLYIEQRKFIAEVLYNAGYRKQSEGEWIPTKTPSYFGGVIYKCSLCGANDGEHSSILGQYCWRCGAKMKGGAE